MERPVEFAIGFTVLAVIYRVFHLGLYWVVAHFNWWGFFKGYQFDVFVFFAFAILGAGIGHLYWRHEEAMYWYEDEQESHLVNRK